MDPSSNEPVIPFRAIGVIRTPFAEPKGAPIQPVYARDAEGRVELAPEFADALADLDGFDRVWLFYWCHLAGPYRAEVVPFRDDRAHGLFATRAPARPNPLGMSCVRLLRVDGPALHVAGVDMVDGSPLLDLKPYVPAFDAFPEAGAGWLDAGRSARTEADDRFA
jgi:tRNA-Thr(GGU) m(6)t(6)A37 methyltransferase TsaA